MLEAKLVVVGGEAKQAEVRLKALPATIGRAREATLTLPHPLVSRKHCEIFEENGQLYVKDLDSLNGTYVNNQRIDGQQPLAPEQLLTLGNVTFRAVYQPVQPVDQTENGRNATAAAGSVGEDRQVAPTEVPAGTEIVDSRAGMADASGVLPAAILPNELPNEPVHAETNLVSPVFEPVQMEEPEVEPTVPQRDVATSHGARSADQSTVHDQPKSDQANQVDQQDRGERPVSASDTGEIDLGELAVSQAQPNGGTSDILISDEELARGPQQSISDSAIANLPGAGPAHEIPGDFAIQDTENAAVEQVDAVDIDLGEEGGSRPDDSSSQLESFVRKLPR